MNTEVIFQSTVEYLNFHPDSVDLRSIDQKHRDYMESNHQEIWVKEMPRKVDFKVRTKKVNPPPKKKR